MTTTWAELDASQSLAELAPCTLLIYTDEKHQIVEVRRPRRRAHLLVNTVGRWARSGVTRMLRSDMRAGEYAEEVLGPGARAMLLPPLVRPPSLIPRPLELLGQNDLGVTLNTIHEFALAIEKGRWWRGRLPVAAAGNPSLRVAMIQDEYTRLKLDLVYRLENPALFDPGVVTTSEFEVALARFDPDQDLSSRAAQAHRIELAFAVAKEHAERVGFRHVADAQRADLRRAAKAARLAQGASTDAERSAALAQTQRILDGLALYFLPRTAQLNAIEPPISRELG